MHPLPVVLAAGFPRAEIWTTRDRTIRPWEPDQQMKKLLKLAEDGIQQTVGRTACPQGTRYPDGLIAFMMTGILNFQVLQSSASSMSSLMK